MDEWKRQWGQNIATWRQARGLSRDEFAGLCDVTPATVSRWENGHLAPRDAHKLQIAEVLDVEVRVLFPLVRS